MKDKAKIKAKKFAYLGGLVDGDGSITIRAHNKAGYQLTLCVYSTSKVLMKKLVFFFGGNYRKMPTKGNRKQKYQWYTSHPEIIKRTQPFTTIKRQSFDIAVEFLNIIGVNPSCREKLYNDLKTANKSFIPVKKGLIVDGREEPTKLDYAVLAGLLDSEGSFTIQKRSTLGNGLYTSSIKISNTDETIFRWLLKKFGGSLAVTMKKNGRDEGALSFSGIDREKLLLAVIPYMVVKRDRANILLQWIRGNKNKTLSVEDKEKMYATLAKLNHRGLSLEANTSSSSPSELKIESELHSDMQSASVVTPKEYCAIVYPDMVPDTVSILNQDR